MSCGSIRRRGYPKSTTYQRPLLAFAAATSTAMGWFGRRCRAVISRASIGASAKGRSTVRRQPATTVQKAGRFYKYPGPGFDGIGDNSAEASYYTWVDQHNTLGLGDNVPISTANLNDGFVALKDGKMVMLRVPYPMGFYAKGLDGRIDDPTAGWKGRGLWSSAGDRAPWLKESGKGCKAVWPCRSRCGPTRSPTRNADFVQWLSRSRLKEHDPFRKPSSRFQDCALTGRTCPAISSDCLFALPAAHPKEERRLSRLTLRAYFRDTPKRPEFTPPNRPLKRSSPFTVSFLQIVVAIPCSSLSGVTLSGSMRIIR